MVKFSTLSGVLEARRAGARVVLQLPLNPPRPVTPGSWAHLVEPARCGLPVTEVRLCNNTRKLMVRLEVRRTRTSFYHNCQRIFAKFHSARKCLTKSLIKTLGAFSGVLNKFSGHYETSAVKDNQLTMTSFNLPSVS